MSGLCSVCGKQLTTGDFTLICSECNGTEIKPYKRPVCDGSGKVSRPPNVAGDQATWTDNNGSPYKCQACDGTGIIFRTMINMQTSRNS